MENAGDSAGGAPQRDTDSRSVRVAREGEPHRLFPLVPGTEWVYAVTGPRDLVPNDRWTMRIVSEPAGDDPGLVELGFGSRLTFHEVFVTNGGVRFEGLPFFAPTELTDVRPRSAEGELVPHIARVVEGAIWTKGSRRELIYKRTDARGRAFEEQAKVSEKDRAQAFKFETVVAPVGRFGAHRIEWLSRVAITSAGRPVLAHLTAEPYRRETMWLAPGIGIIRRSISYLLAGKVRAAIAFDLIRYEAGEDCVLEDSL